MNNKIASYKELRFLLTVKGDEIMKYKLKVYFFDEEEPRIYNLKTKDEVIQQLISLNYLGNVEDIHYQKVR